MQLGYSNSDMTDPYIVFATDDECRDYLEYNINNGVRFYAKDSIDFQTFNEVHGGVVNNPLNRLTIETNAMVTIKNDYLIVSLKDKSVWRVDYIVIKDDGRMKRNSMRPRKKTYITMIGCDNDEWR